MNKGLGEGYSDRCQFCHEFGEKVAPYLGSDGREKIIKLGYRFIPELKVLSSEQLRSYPYKVSTALRDAFTEKDGTLISPLTYSFVDIEKVAQAQRDYDMEQLSGK